MVDVLPATPFTGNVPQVLVDFCAVLGDRLRIVTLDEESTKVLFRDLAEIDQRRQRDPYLPSVSSPLPVPLLHWTG